MKKTARIILVSLSFLVIVALVIIATGWWWIMHRPVPMEHDIADYVVEQGSGPRKIAATMTASGIHLHPDAFVLLARFSEKDKHLQAGAYEAKRGDTLWSLLERMVSGDMTQARLTFVEGWTYQRLREVLRQDPNVRQTPTESNDAELLKRLGIEHRYAEGLFYPDTYVFTPGTADYDILRRAHQAQDELLMKLWEQRAPICH